jgi:hypothetical protein
LPADKVFISYSHDSAEHSAKVLALADSLRAKGVDVELDQYYVRPPSGWPLWMYERFEASRFVVMVCTAIYRARVEKKVAADEGRGVFWEGTLIYNEIYSGTDNSRFVPVLFDAEPETSLLPPLSSQTRYRLRDFALTDPQFELFYRELTNQPKVKKPDLGGLVIFSLVPKSLAAAEPDLSVPAPLPERKAITQFPPPVAPPVDITRISAYAPDALIGREAETAVIAEAWRAAANNEPHPHVLTFVALGGEGKTSLVADFANKLAARGWPDCDATFAWTFYRQGSDEQAGASSDLFLAEAFAVFGLTAREGESGYDKGKRLAQHIAEKRALLILDGVEPLQYPPSSPQEGEWKDDGLKGLLRVLSGGNAGLCLVTTRYRIADLKGEAAPQHDLSRLSDEAGAELLTRLGVNGPEKDKRRLVADVRGHALTLAILGGFLRKAHGGDIAKRDRVKFEAADARIKNGHAFRAMKAYADWLASAGDSGARALAMLRLTGLFDRPASAGCLGALLEGPAIAGLTEPLVDANDAEQNFALSDLEDAKLLTVTRAANGALVDVDAHPLLREYFACQLRDTLPDAAREAHRRLYKHLTTTTVDKEAPTLDDLAPLYQAVAHGSAAGLWQETCDEVYHERIYRGAESYAVKKLGAFGADLGAVACFFEAPWRRVSPHLTPADQALMMNLAGFRLRALGRLDEAREPMRAALEMRVVQMNWREAAIDAGNLSELELTLGGVAEAGRLGAMAVAHADRSGDLYWRHAIRPDEADARHQAGELAAAEALFATAETMQAEQPGQSPRLTSLQGYQYCDLKLAAAETAAWRRLNLTPAPAREGSRDVLTEACAEAASRASEALALAERNRELFAIGLDRLTLARAALYASVLRGETPSGDAIDVAVAALRHAGQQDYLPLTLLTRALYRAVTGDFPGAQDDLDEAYEIAERGPMRLFLADIHLHRARLFGLIANRPPKYPWSSPADDLAQARKLIETCGYGRRLPELADAEEALAAL